MERTANLIGLQNGESFTWGELKKIHEVGEYHIVEFCPWKVKDSRVLLGNPDYDIKHFHCYIDGKDKSRSTESLDSALAECIAIKHDGINTTAGTYFIKMISSEEK